MTNYNRISSIDIMRGLTVFLMLFVNDLNMNTAPSWLGHAKATFDGMGLADWVFPGFLFIVGMALPFSLSKRYSQGQRSFEISKHIIRRTVSLLVIGVLMLNSGRVNAELTGMSENLWSILMYIGVFLVWNNYPNKENNFFLVTGLKLAGLTALVLLVFKFRSGQLVNYGSLITGWWGILGLIGWGYLVTALTYVAFRDSIIKTALVAGFFLTLNILSKLNLLEFLKPVQPVLGVIIEGNVPLIVLTGMIAGLILKKIPSNELRRIISAFIILGVVYLAAGFILRRWFIISKIQATPSWGLICNGISMLVFIILYWIIDVQKVIKWASFFRPAGENALTTYLFPDILYYLIWSTGIPFLIYKESADPLIVTAGSVVWAALMVWLTSLLVRLNIRLKL
jgi:heparan-alpha-glucosaminide N-acetyltransferase